jgi:hypothetical protein
VFPIGITTYIAHNTLGATLQIPERSAKPIAPSACRRSSSRSLVQIPDCPPSRSAPTASFSEGGASADGASAGELGKIFI